VLHKPYSVGTVTIRSPAPDVYPSVDFNFLSDERDVAALSSGVQFALGLLADPGFAALSTGNGLLKMKTAARMISMRTPRNRLASVLLGGAASVLKPLERKLLDLVVKDIPDSLRHPDGHIGEALRDAVLAQSHPVGTCAMGRADDAAAVTDASGQVHGLGGLYVADASIFPSIPRANTNIPVMMVAEKISAHYIGRSAARS
jgi:5-(hydroxymethyl)furfural/furfural oxidase